MFKKLISLMITAIMFCGVLSNTVNADAPLYFDGITTNVFDIDFGDVRSASDAPELVFDGSWDYTGEFMGLPGTKNGSIKTRNNIELAGAYGYEFSSETIMTQNSMIMYLAYNANSSSGYKVEISKKFSKISLYRAGSETEEKVLKTASVSVNYGTPYVWSAKLEDKTLTVSMGSTVVLTYTDEQMPGLNGVFGVESVAIENFAVLDMKLDKLGKGITVSDWKYETKFSKDDTVEGLKAEGITTTHTKEGNLSFADGSIKYTGLTGTANLYYDKALKGDYTIKLSYYTYNGNATSVKFNSKDSKNFFDIHYDIKSTKKYRIRKVVGGEDTSSTTTNLDTIYAESAYSSTSGLNTVTHVINVKDNGDETITVKAIAYKGENSTKNQLATVSAVIKKSDLYNTDYNKINVYAGAPGKNCYFYDFSVYSTPSNEIVSRDVDLLNKTVVTGDTTTSLEKKGIIVSHTPTKITSATATGGPNYYGNTKDGLYWTDSKNHVYVGYADKVSGDYTFEATTKAMQNGTTFQVNRIDDNNQYTVEVSARTCDITIKKTEGGKTTGSATKKLTNAAGAEINSGLYGYGHTTTINVENNDGTLKITADVYATSGKIIGHCEYTDNTGTPFTSGLCRIYMNNSQGYRMLYDMKITQHGTYTEDGSYIGKFYVDGEEVTSYKKGTIYFETPVVDLGTYTVAAALYEDHEMTDIKTFTPREIYEGKVRLFDTTDSTAVTSEVKVFFLDSGDTLNKTMEVWNLR